MKTPQHPRRPWLAAALVSLSLFLVFGAQGIPAAAAEAKDEPPRPHVVFILADDLGWADVGYHGSKIKTPNIDRLAREGRRFERHYVLPTCTPTRVGLISGRFPSRFGVLSPAYGKIFEDDAVTLPSALREAGYRTSISGKWHMGSPPDYVPRRYGFDTSYGYFHGQIDPYTHLYKTGVRSWHRNDKYLEEEGHATDLITREAVRIIESEHDKPFFLYVAYSVPHFPLDEPEEWTSMYEETYDEWSRRQYAASVTHMDERIGDILEALEREGLQRQTLVVFASDNGGQRSWSSKSQYKGRYADKPHKVLGDNRPLRGWKGDVYEGGIRVPACVSWPGVIEPGVIAAPVHIVDWMPTLCRLAGYASARDLAWDGKDIWPLISGEVNSLDHRPLYWKTPGQSALRFDDWKLVVGRDGRQLELFHLEEDPLERTDLAGKHPAKLAELKALHDRVAKKDRGRS